MFTELTDAELIALFIRIKSGRDRAWDATGSGQRARTQVVLDATDIMNDIHIENAGR